jgi:multisubunit Na+/H+ antiporter MnhB subunit
MWGFLKMSKEKKTIEGMTLIAKTVTNCLISVIAMFGAYIAFYGHLTPGGGFAGGVIIACAFILLMLSHSKSVSLKKFPDLAASLLDNIGALSFVLIGLLGYIGGAFFFNFIKKDEPFGLLSAGTILFSNISILIKVMAGLFAVFVGLSIWGRIVSDSDKEE